VASDGTFSVHLQALQQFEQELQTQLEGLTKPLDRIASVAQSEPPLGSFPEGQTLAARHLAVASQMYTVLQAVRQAVAFAGEVTKTVTATYQKFDGHAASNLGFMDQSQLASYANTLDPGVVGPNTLGQTTTGARPIAIQISSDQPANITVTGDNVPANLPIVVQGPGTTSTPITYSDPSIFLLEG
jgi:hypothetical protein